MKLLTITFTFVLILSSVLAKKIQFEDCSDGLNLADIEYVDVEPCTEEPCIFKKGTTAKMTAKLKSKADIADASIEVTVEMDEIEVPYPGIETDVCKKVPCPIKIGQEMPLEYEIEVEDFFPEMITYMKWVATEDSSGKQIICAKAKIGVKD